MSELRQPHRLRLHLRRLTQSGRDGRSSLTLPVQSDSSHCPDADSRHSYISSLAFPISMAAIVTDANFELCLCSLGNGTRRCHNGLHIERRGQADTLVQRLAHSIQRLLFFFTLGCLFSLCPVLPNSFRHLNSAKVAVILCQGEAEGVRRACAKDQPGEVRTEGLGPCG